MSLRSDAVNSRLVLVGRARGAFGRLPALVAALAVGGLSACGGGDSGPAAITVNTSASGIVEPSMTYGGPVQFQVLKGAELVTTVSVDSGQPFATTLDPAKAPPGTDLRLAISKHPRNQLCTVQSPDFKAGSTELKASVNCVPAILNDTGVTECATPGNQAACNAQDSAGGRDAERDRLTRVSLDTVLGGKTGFDYTKLCNSGHPAGSQSCPANPTRGSASSEWGCTRDNVTGLVWLIRAAPQGPRPASGLSPEPKPFTTGSSACGFESAEWSIPTVHELASLMHSGLASDKIAANDQYFPNLAEASSSDSSGRYLFWTSSKARDNNMLVNFGSHGSVDIANVNGEHYIVWVARKDAHSSGVSAANRFTASADGLTVTDRQNGLAWSVCSLGRTTTTTPSTPCSGDATGYGWTNALLAVATANTNRWAGQSDWRLPSRAELASLLDYSVVGPADSVLIPSGNALGALRADAGDATTGQGVSYWSSTAAGLQPGEGLNTCSAVVAKPYSVNFGEGDIAALPEKFCGPDGVPVILADNLRVRLVRDAR